MGLDGEIYAQKGDGKAIEFKDIIEWRKHYGIQIWMHRLADSKGARYEDEDGWYGPVTLTWEDLDRFKDALEAGALTDLDCIEHRTYTEAEKTEIINAIERARSLLNDGWEILYSSSY